MNADEVIERLCKLQADVQEHIGYDSAADCFCGKGGYWGAEGYGGTFEEGYRNDGKALEFIENAVRQALHPESTKGTTWNKGPDEIHCTNCGLTWDRHIADSNWCPKIVIEGNPGSEPAEPFKSELRKAGFLADTAADCTHESPVETSPEVWLCEDCGAESVGAPFPQSEQDS